MNRKSILVTAILIGLVIGCGEKATQSSSKASATSSQPKAASDRNVSNVDFKMGYVPDNYSASDRELVRKACANVAVNMVPRLGYSGGLQNIESCNVLQTSEGATAAVSFRDGNTAVIRTNPMRIFVGNGVSGNCFFVVPSNMTVLKSFPVSAYDLCR